MATPYKHVCENCGREYMSANATFTCSVACRDERVAKRKLAAAAVAECPICGEIKPLLRTSYGVKVCSARCVKIDAQRKWYEKNRDARIVRRRDYGQTGYWRKLRDSATHCALCGTPREKLRTPAEMGYKAQWRVATMVFHVDHVVPFANGGTDEPENVRVVCWFCNRARGTMTDHDEGIAAAGRAFWASESSTT